MQALEFLKWVRDCMKCCVLDSNKHAGVFTFPSNSELKRMLDNKAVLINGVRPLWNEDVSFPVKSLVFFPSSNDRITTIVRKDN